MPWPEATQAGSARASTGAAGVGLGLGVGVGVATGVGLGEGVVTGLGVGLGLGLGLVPGVGAPLTVMTLSESPPLPPPQAVRPPVIARHVAIHKWRTRADLIWSMGSFFSLETGLPNLVASPPSGLEGVVSAGVGRRVGPVRTALVSNFLYCNGLACATKIRFYGYFCNFSTYLRGSVKTVSAPGS
jgi:hypothetical protein